jgi:uncharacterized protein (TIGR00290 family)
MKDRVLLSWSGGKDSALALYELRQSGAYEVSALLTTVTQEYDRISMHGVRTVLLEQQARSLGLPLEKVYISRSASNVEYESQMLRVLKEQLAAGVYYVAFGDIFLEDLRQYREENLSRIGMMGIFPIWKRDSAELAKTFTEQGFEAVITCVDSHSLDGRFVGREFDRQFLAELPSTVDPCGENGEFHSFAHNGPIFRNRIRYEKGEIVLRDDRFYYCDLIPVSLYDPE